MTRLIQALRGVILSLIVVFGTAAVVFLHQGCDGGDEGPRPAEEDGESAEDGAATAGGSLRVPGSDPVTLDPALAGDAVSATYVVEIFGGLVTIDRDLNIVPDIAKSWEVSPDGKVYTFHLRDDVIFHYSNRLVTAEDFKYSMERAASPETASMVAEAYLGDIIGARDMVRGRADEIGGIEVVDDFTLQITIDEPKPYFLAKLTYPTAFVVDRNQIESNPRNWLWKPHGTGPYKLKEWRLGEKIVLEANERYHLGAPGVQRVDFLLSGGSLLTMYENGEIDVSGVGINDIERVQDPDDPLSDEYVSADELSVWYLGFNTQRPPFDDANVRRAFGMALDREKIAEVLLMNVLPVAHGIMPPGLPGYNPDAQTLSYDPEGAKQLLADSKYGGPDGLPEVTISEIGGGATAGLDTQAMIDMWEKNLGVEVEIEQTEEATFWQDLDKGQYQMFTAGWIMDYPDPEDIIDILFYSKSRQNNTRYGNPEVDAVILQARTEQDVARRMELYQQAERMILEDAPWVPLYYGRDHVVVKPYVREYLLTPMVIPKLRYVTVER